MELAPVVGTAFELGCTDPQPASKSAAIAPRDGAFIVAQV
jgi:hypothetical protein